MKNGLYTITFNVKDHGLCPVSKIKQYEQQMLWDYNGIVYFELLPLNRTIISNIYYQKLLKFNSCLQQKRPELVNHIGPHTSLDKIWWKSPDLAPTNYYLFLSLAGKKFTSDDTLKTYMEDFFAGKNKKFYQDGIMKLPERWQFMCYNKNFSLFKICLFMLQ